MHISNKQCEACNKYLHHSQCPRYSQQSLQVISRTFLETMQLDIREKLFVMNNSYTIYKNNESNQEKMINNNLKKIANAEKDY